MSIKKLITAYLMLVGVLIGPVIFGTIIVIETWFPRIWKAWEEHNRLVQSVWFTAGFFVLWVSRYWQWRRRGFFWVSICMFFLVHTLGVLYYAARVHPLVLQEWIVLLTAESFIVCFLHGLVDAVVWSPKPAPATGPSQRDTRWSLSGNRSGFTLGIRASESLF